MAEDLAQGIVEAAERLYIKETTPHLYYASLQYISGKFYCILPKHLSPDAHKRRFSEPVSALNLLADLGFYCPPEDLEIVKNMPEGKEKLIILTQVKRT